MRKFCEVIDGIYQLAFFSEEIQGHYFSYNVFYQCRKFLNESYHLVIFTLFLLIPETLDFSIHRSMYIESDVVVILY